MKILFLTPRIPYPPIKGDSLRSFYFIKELSRNNRIDLITFYEDENERKSLEELKKYCVDIQLVKLDRRQSYLNVAKRFFNFRPFQVNYYYSKEMEKVLKDRAMTGKYDAVHIVLQRMMPYAVCFDRQKIVLDQIDALSMNMKRRALVEKNPLFKAFFYFEYLNMKRYEQSNRREYAACVITSEVDKKAIGDERITVVPNGVDSEYYSAGGREEKDIDLIFTGNMSYFPNVDAAVFLCREILPEILKSEPGAKVYIVGVNPAQKVKELDDRKNVFVTGFVPDVREYLNRAKVFAAPLRSGSGIQNKVLEAMACALPVVASSKGNAGVGAKPGEELIIADSPAAFAEAAVELLHDAEKRKKLGINGRILVNNSFAWSQRARALEKLYGELIRA